MKINSRLRIMLLLVFALVTTAGVSFAENWPRFRGPNGTGIVMNAKIPVEWKKDDILWKVKIPGQGNSSPVIWENKLFLQSALPDGSQRMLVCLDAQTGEALWKQTIPAGSAKIHKMNTLASSTPAVDGKRVYVSFWDGSHVTVTAYDLNGKMEWNRNLGSFTSQHGAGASPIVAGDKVFLLFDQDEKASLVALNAANGKTVWEKPRPAYRACYGSPFLWNRGGDKELVVVTTLELTGYNPATGKVNWRYPWKHSSKFPLRVTASPTYLGDVIFASSGDGGGDRNTLALKVNGKGGDYFTEVLWNNKNKKDFPYVPTTLAHDGKLYFVHDKGYASCFDAKTGKKIWSERLPDANFTASPLLINGKIYAPSEEGFVFVLGTGPMFEILARNELGEIIRATPAVANDRLYIRGNTHLFCIGEPNQK